MKFLLIIITGLILSSASLASTMELSFKETERVEKVIVMDEILINDLIKLYNDFDFEGERMIAGKFDRKTSKKSYLDGLRTKLEGHKGVISF